MPAAVPAPLARARFPVPVVEVLRRLGGAGHRSWLVGGAVRDLLLERRRTGADFDVATPARPEQVIALFPKVIPTGIAHGTVTVLLGGHKVEVTTFRGEGRYVDGRRPESVTFHDDLEADLARRDFTINALAYDPLARDLRDPFGGREDLRRRKVRAVGSAAERFAEDGLRPVRAVRFAAQLGFRLAPGTEGAIPGALEVVRKVAAERIAEELTKLVLAPGADGAIRLLGRTGLLGVVAPPLAGHSRGALAHAAAVVAGAPAEPALRFAAFLHGLVPAEAEALLVGLRLPRRLVSEVEALVRAHACLAARRGRMPSPGSDAELRRWVFSFGPERAGAVFALLLAEARALPAGRRARGVQEVKSLRARVAAVLSGSPPLAIAQLALDGRAVARELGTPPGPHVGEALRHLLDRVLDDPGANTPDALSKELRRWWADRSGRL